MDVCVFVDGENFRRSLKNIFKGKIGDHLYLPENVAWASFFDWLVQESFGKDARRLRTYWYVIEQVDFYPWKVPNSRREMDSLLHILRKNEVIRDKLEHQPNNTDKIATDYAQILNERRQQFVQRFEGWQVIQDGISKVEEAVEFRRAGAITYNLFERKMGSEKAVDVNLGTDLITLQKIYDGALLVSGDQDFVPAVNKIKDLGKRVVNVAFKTNNGKLLPGGARRLNIITDGCYEVTYKNLAKFFGVK